MNEMIRLLGKGQRLWDYDSIGRGSAKELLDAVVATGWFVDDGPQWITGCRYDQDADKGQDECGDGFSGSNFRMGCG